MRPCRKIFRNVQTSKRIENAISLDAKSVAETIPILRFNPLYTRTSLLIYGLTLVRSNSSLRRTTENLPTFVPTTLDTKQYIAAEGDTENRKIGTPIPITRKKCAQKHCKTKQTRSNGCTNVRKCILLADDFYDPFQTLVPPTP